MEARKHLIQTAFDTNNDWLKFYDKLKKKELANDIQEHEGNFLTILDSQYPDYLKQGYMPPFVLQYEGNIELLKSKTRLSIVVSRQDNEFKRLNDALNSKKDDLVLVIGYHKFVEQLLISSDYKVICVLDKPINELDTPTRKAILRNGGLIISENFVSQRDEMGKIMAIALMGKIQSETLVVSISKRSSSLIQINQAVEKNQKVIVFPTDIDSPYYNNELIYEGGEIFRTSEQLA